MSLSFLAPVVRSNDPESESAAVRPLKFLLALANQVLIRCFCFRPTVGRFSAIGLTLNAPNDSDSIHSTLRSRGSFSVALNTQGSELFIWIFRTFITKRAI